MTADLVPFPEAPPPPDTNLTLPHDPAAERAVLGGMLQSTAAIIDATDTLTADDFHRPAHETIYAAIETLYSRGEGVDAITVTDHLRSQQALRKVGGSAYIFELINATPVAGNTGYYADIVASLAARRRLHAAGTAISAIALTPSAGSSPTELKTAATALLEDVRTLPPGVEPDGSHPWAPQDLDAAWDTDDAEQPTILARTDGVLLLYPGAVHSISGEPETGKTWVALIAAAQQLADGHDVTYVDFEDRATRLLARLRALGVPREQVTTHLRYIRPTAALDTIGRAHLDAAVKTSPLAIIDGVTEAMTMHGLSLLDNEDAARYLHLLPRHMADLGPAVLQIDHVVKDSERQGRWAIGAGHKLAGLDGAAYTVKLLEPFGRGKKGRALITIAKDRPGSVREHASGPTIAELVIDSTADDGTSYAWLEPPTSSTTADGDFRPTVLMERVSRCVEMHPGIGKRDLEQQVRGKGTAVRQAIQILLDEGWIREEPGPGRTRWIHEVRPFRRSDDASGGDE